MNRISRILFLCCLFVSIVITVQAQQLPQTNLYLFEMNQKSDSLYIFRKPKFLNKFNINGYNNQPNFISPNELYLTVQMPEDTTQTDIYSLNLSTNTLTQVTNTVEGEFSPAYMPTSSMGGTQFSAIRVESEDNQVMQRLWQFPVNRSNNGSPVFKTLDKVGYFCWISPSRVALFIVGPPHTLAIADVNTERTTNIAANIGRCIQKLPDNAIAYVQKSSTKWTINKLNPITRLTEPIISTLPNSEDFIVLPDGSLIMGNGGKLFHYRPGKDMDWREIADLSFYGINNITRLAFNGDKQLAVVSD